MLLGIVVVLFIIATIAAALIALPRLKTAGTVMAKGVDAIQKLCWRASGNSQGYLGLTIVFIVVVGLIGSLLFSLTKGAEWVVVIWFFLAALYEGSRVVKLLKK